MDRLFKLDSLFVSTWLPDTEPLRKNRQTGSVFGRGSPRGGAARHTGARVCRGGRGSSTLIWVCRCRSGMVLVGWVAYGKLQDSR